MEIRKIGVEEELLLLDPRTGVAAPRSTEVARGDVEQELFLHQVETKTDPVVGLDDLRRALVGARGAAGTSAADAGLALVACGAEPLAGPPSQVTPDDRYRDLLERFGDIAAVAGTCGMHVHVDVADEDEGVQVLDRIGMWLPVLLALSASSPFYDGHDTGYASWRAQVWSRWPTAGPTELFGTPERYHALVDRLVATGAARDEGNVYFDARLSREWPTIELRVADVCTEVDDAVLVAALGRALVDSAARWAREGTEVVVPRTEIERAATWVASRHGLSADLVDPVTCASRPASEVLRVVLDALGPSLEEAGDLEWVSSRLRDDPPRGPTHQREVHRRGGSVRDVVDDLVRRTERTWRGGP